MPDYLLGLDAIDRPDRYGKLMAYPEARAARAVPIGISARVVVTRLVAPGATITEADVDEAAFVVRLRRLLNMLYGEV